MNFLILGAGGRDSFYYTKLIFSGHLVTLVARGMYIKRLQQYSLKLQHPKFTFNNHFNTSDLKKVKSKILEVIEAVIDITKSTLNKNVAKELSLLFNFLKKTPYQASLKNKIKNRGILCNYLDERIK